MTAAGGQQLPAEDLDMKGFPVESPEADRGYFRAHDPKGALFFSSTPTGRFNILKPRGTCYLADTMAAAVRERIRTPILSTGVVSEAMADFVVSSVEVPELFCASVSDARAADYGVTVNLTGSTDDYTVPRAWAEAFAAWGFDGVRYTAKHTPGAANSWALFSDTGAHQPDGWEVVMSVRPHIQLTELGVLVAPMFDWSEAQFADPADLSVFVD